MYIDLCTKRGYDIAAALVGSGVYQIPTLKQLITGSVREACRITHCNKWGGKLGTKPGDFHRLRLLVVEVKWLRHQLREDHTLRIAVHHWLTHAVRGMKNLTPLHDTWLHKFTTTLEAATGIANYRAYDNDWKEAWDTLEEMLK